MGMRRSFKPTNLVRNGDFANGTQQWFPVYAFLSVNDNELTMLANTQYGNVSGYFHLIKDNKYYYRGLVKADSVFVSLRFYDTVELNTIEHVGANTTKLLSGVAVSSATTIGGLIRVQDSRSSGWSNIYIKEMMCINLTPILPPHILALSNTDLTKWCDLNIPNWFDGTISDGKIGGIGGLK